MRQGISVIVFVIAALMMSGCVGTPDKEGWRYGQKSEFLEILKNDKYLSICNQRGLYEKIRQESDSVLMSRMLVAYAQNLANSCIDLADFEAGQKEKKARRIESHYELYMQDVNIKQIAMKLRAGSTIEAILAPYVPKNEQFGKLVNTYNALAESGTATKEQLHKIRLNIERIKLMNDDLGNDYALVNIPEFVVRVKKMKKQT